jgi:MSHA biogenesis protein MshK
MVESLKNHAKYSIMALGLLWSLGAAAEALNDPTRPPDNVLQPSAQGQSPANAGPVLQMVTISRFRKSATISGQEVRLGGKYGDAVLIQVRDGEAKLRNPDGTVDTLHMFGDIQKKPVPAAGSKRRER